MVLFFGIAAKEITEACLPGGDLNPPAKAMNPLIATIGGVVGPVAAFFAGLELLFAFGVYERGVDDWTALARGWGVPTATDIALAWLVARAVFGRGHPAINFLLLLAVVDDGIGLAIIALFYGDPAHPAQPAFLGLVLLGMALAFALRRLGVKSWIPYVALGGPLAWLGLTLARLHPALALAFIVPFLPGPRRDAGLFVDADDDHPSAAPVRAPAQALRRLRPVLVRVHAGGRDARRRRPDDLARARLARDRQDRRHRALRRARDRGSASRCPSG